MAYIVIVMPYIEVGGPDAVVKAACLESRGLRFRTNSGFRVSKKQNVYSQRTRNDSILREPP